jgi:hypothetical protein
MVSSVDKMIARLGYSGGYSPPRQVVAPHVSSASPKPVTKTAPHVGATAPHISPPKRRPPEIKGTGGGTIGSGIPGVASTGSGISLTNPSSITTTVSSTIGNSSSGSSTTSGPQYTVGSGLFSGGATWTGGVTGFLAKLIADLAALFNQG